MQTIFFDYYQNKKCSFTWIPIIILNTYNFWLKDDLILHGNNVNGDFKPRPWYKLCHLGRNLNPANVGDIIYIR